MAYFDTVWYANYGDGSTTGYWAVPKRAQNAAVAAGALARQFTTPSQNNERVFICRTAGTTANTTDATWSLTRGAGTTDGTAVWQECTGMAAVNGDAVNTLTWNQLKALGTPSLGVIIKRNSGTSYQVCTAAGTLGAAEPAFSDTAGTATAETSATATWRSLGVVGNFTGGQAPHARLAAVFASGWYTVGNTIYLASAHAETASNSSMTISGAGAMTKVLCHNGGAYPPLAANLTTGAAVISSGGGDLILNLTGSLYAYGVTFKAGSTIQFNGGGSAASWFRLDACLLEMTAASAGPRFYFNGSTLPVTAVLNNCTVKFLATSQSLILQGSNLVWRNTGQILAAGSSVPATLFQMPANYRVNNVLLEGLDLSQLTGSVWADNSNGAGLGSITVKDCKLNATTTLTRPTGPGFTTRFLRCDDGAETERGSLHTYEGSDTIETVVTRVGGATDRNDLLQARKVVTTSNAEWLRPFRLDPFVVWNLTIGADVTVTVYGFSTASVVPNDDDIWLEASYLGSPSSPLITVANTSKVNVLTANALVAADTSDWGWVELGFDGATSNVTVSNNYLTVTHNNTSNNSGAVSLSMQSTGKYYFEVTETTVHGDADAGGILRAGGTFNSGVANDCFIVNRWNGMIFANNTTSGFALGVVNSGDIVSYAIDLTARKGWARKNGGNWNNQTLAASNPATGVGGISIHATGAFAPFILFGNTGTAAGDNMTANFGATAYAYAVPSGFSNWPNTTLAPFKLVATLSSPQPRLAGYIEARVRVGKPSATYYIDPVPVLV